MNAVIGSGPAAIAAAKALVSQGAKVVIFDVGDQLEPERQEIVKRMSRQSSCSWRKEDLDVVVGKRELTSEAVHSKLSFGSAYSFAPESSPVDVRWSRGTGFRHSLARGGLSNVWGSALLPYRQSDIGDWPVTVEDLEPHYRAVMEFVPTTAVSDELDELLPSYATRNQELEPSRQGQSLLDDLAGKSESLKKAGIYFGRSRLAIQVAGDESRRACTRCALCLSGCPYGLIYSSAHTLAELLRNPLVEYRPAHFVEELLEEGEEVVVKGRNLARGEDFVQRVGRVFVGAGVLPTAKIVLKSRQAFDRPVVVKDSQYFIYPLLRLAATDGVEEESMHTSSQVFVEIEDKGISEHLIHLQVYGYSSFLHHELNRTFLRIPLRSAAFRRHFLGRLLIAQGFLHSKESGSIELVLKQKEDGGEYLSASKSRPRSTLVDVLKVGWKLLAQAWNFRAVPLLPGLQYPDPGSGYHSGGSFPMRRQPGEFETDTLGRLPGWDRIHLVDSSVLPSIPATSITFSVMANAHRIATLAAGLEPA